MPLDPSDPAYRGQADYGRAMLRAYDHFVPVVGRIVWRCPGEPLIENYQRHIRIPHLDVGPGTGSLIARSGLPDGSAVTLLDPNVTVLAYAAAHLPRLSIETVEADVLKPLPVAGPFASAALNLVLHCLPGPSGRKAIAIANIAAVLEPDGVLFGASVLGLRGPQTRLSRGVLRAFNRRGAFDNLADSESGLREIIGASFERVELQIVGSVAIFSAFGPRPPHPNAIETRTVA
jgi:SAM-dependent methyltransferase